jgi:hypothetical protein
MFSRSEMNSIPSGATRRVFRADDERSVPSGRTRRWRHEAECNLQTVDRAMTELLQAEGIQIIQSAGPEEAPQN